MTPADNDNEPDDDDDDFFTDDPDDPNMWRVGPIEARECTLADRTVTFRIPEAWEMTARLFDHAEFKISGLDGADVLFVADSFENPAAIAADDLKSYLAFPAGQAVDNDEFDEISAAVRTADGRIDWKKITLRREAHRNDSETGLPYADAIIWRRLCVLPPAHIRMLTVTLSLPLAENDAGNPARDVLNALIHHTTDAAQFSETRTRADQIAETPDLAAHWFDDITALRLPPAWQRQSTPGEDNLLPSYSYDDPENDEWTFWVQNLILPLRGLGSEGVAGKLKAFLEKSIENGKIKRESEEFALFSNPDDPLAGYMRNIRHEVSGETDSEPGVPLRRTSWRVAKGAPDMIVILMVHWVVVDRIANRPDIVALTNLLEAEVPNALILADLAAEIFE
jgi:hypothetical protein